MKAKDTIKSCPLTASGWRINCDPKCHKSQAEISFKAGIRHTLSRAVTDGCLSTVNGKHGVHIPDKLYSELKKEGER